MTATTRSTEVREALARYAPWGVVAAVAAYYAVVAASANGPAVIFDEVGYLAQAHQLANPDATWALCGNGYSAGLPLLLAPLWWISSNPATVYAAAIGLVVACGVAVMWPAYRLALALGARRAQAVVAAAVVTLPAARVLTANFVLPETLLTLLVVGTAAAVASYASSRRPATLLLAAALVGAASVVHARALPLAVVTAVWAAVAARRRISLAVSAVAVIGALVAAGLVLQTWLSSQVFPSSDRIGATSDRLGNVDAARLATVALGQGWAQATSWVVLTAFGLGIAVVAWKRKRGPLERSAWLWLGAGALAQAAFFVVFLARANSWGFRLDVPIYGRYLDPFVVPLAVVGAVALLRGTNRRVLGIAAISTTVVVALAPVAIAATLSDTPAFVDFAILGALPFVTGGTLVGFWWLAGAVTAGLAAAVWALSRWPRVAVALLAVYFVAGALRADVAVLDPAYDQSRVPPPYGALLDSKGETEVGIAENGLPCAVRNKASYWLVDKHVVIFDANNEELPARFIVAPAEWPAAKAAGATRIFGSVWLDWGVWRFPPS